MNKIKTIIGEGFKTGENFTVPLSGVTLIYGGNRRGKTRVLEALELLLTAQVASIGTQPHVLFKALACADYMAVGGVTDDDKSVMRRYRLKASRNGGSVSYDELFTEHLGDTPPYLFCPSAFLQMSDRKRVAYLARTLGGSVSLEEVLSAIKGIKCENHTKNHEESITLICDMARMLWDEKGNFASLKDWLSNLKEKNSVDAKWARDYGSDEAAVSAPTDQDWMAILCEAVRVQGNQARAEADRMAKTILGISQLQEDPQSLPRAESKKSNASNDLQAATTKHAELGERWTATNRDVKTAEATLAAIKPIDQTLINELKKQLRGMETRPDHVPNTVEIDDKIMAFDEGCKLYGRSTAEMAEALEKKLEECLQSVTSLSNIYSVIKNSLATLNREIADIESKDCCPYCKSKKQGWKEPLIADKKSEAEKITIELGQALAAFEKAKEKKEDTRSKLATVNSEIRMLRDAVVGFKNAHQDRNKIIDNCNKVNAQRALDIATLKGKIAEHETADAKAGDPVAAQQTVNQLRIKLEEVAALGLTAKEEKQRCETSLRDAESEHSKAIQDAASIRQMRMANEQADKFKAEQETYAATLDVIEMKSLEMVKSSVAPLMNFCNKLFTPVIGSSLEYRDGTIGYVSSEHRFVPWRTFSGAEREVMLAALGVGLASRNQFKLAVIDEMGNLDDTRQVDLVKTLCSLVKSRDIDQAVLCGVRSVPCEVNGIFTQIQIQ